MTLADFTAMHADHPENQPSVTKPITCGQFLLNVTSSQAWGSDWKYVLLQSSNWITILKE